MTVEDFYLFTDARPDDEKWELFDGEPFLNASPLEFHQVIIKNVIFFLALHERRHAVPWRVIPGIGARVSDTSRPEPDVMVLPVSDFHESRRDTRDALVLFEVLSPSTARRDLHWKREAYTTLPALQDYVVIAQDHVEVVVFSRAYGFAERRLQSAKEALQLGGLGVTLPLGEIYRDTGLV
jgi:Uma2 family endonuclease